MLKILKFCQINQEICKNDKYSNMGITVKIKGVNALEVILLVWGVRDEVLEELPVEGYWLYGEYDFIAKVDFRDEAELAEFTKSLHKKVGNKFTLYPVVLSHSKEQK